MEEERMERGKEVWTEGNMKEVGEGEKHWQENKMEEGETKELNKIWHWGGRQKAKPQKNI